MLIEQERVKHSATWGGAKNAPPAESKGAESQSARKRQGAKRVAQFLLCFGLLLTTVLPASAQQFKNKLAPELQTLFTAYSNGQVKGDTKIPVIVQYSKNHARDGWNTFKRHRDKLDHQLDVVNADHLTVNVQGVFDLVKSPEVKYVSWDRPVKMSVDDVTSAVAADVAWSYGFDGTGVGIAVIDSGIYSHPDLNSSSLASRVVYSESFVPGDTATGDAYGHGTHVAGIAAGNGSQSQSGSGYAYNYQGVAPNANIVNLRVLDANGSGTDSSVIAAIQRAIQLKSQYNIRIINLSLGRPVYESFTQDPLDQAVEQAWQQGILVVCAAGNNGRDTSLGTNGYGTIGVPGNDPYVLTVGAMDTKGTFSTGDDAIASYSSKGPTLIDHVVKPDVVAPGNKVVSLLDPNGSLVIANPTLDILPTVTNLLGGLLGSQPQSQYFTLSGTSMATPVVSGAAALMFQKDPTLTPDLVKARLMKTADKHWTQGYTSVFDRMRNRYNNQGDAFTYGAGYMNIPAALNNNDSGTGVAISPRAVMNPNNGLIMIDPRWNTQGQSILWGNSVLWGNSILWGNSVLWGDSVLWGNSLVSGSSVLWGNSVVWGNSSTTGYSILWGNSVLWGDSANTAYSEGDGDCQGDPTVDPTACE